MCISLFLEFIAAGSDKILMITFVLFNNNASKYNQIHLIIYNIKILTIIYYDIKCLLYVYVPDENAFLISWWKFKQENVHSAAGTRHLDAFTRQLKEHLPITGQCLGYGRKAPCGGTLCTSRAVTRQSWVCSRW
mgnify:CR=1 FL=1|jgi:hypothetical protein